MSSLSTVDRTLDYRSDQIRDYKIVVANVV